MKKLISILLAVLLVETVEAQSPQKMSYQAVIRNSSDELIANHVVGMRVSILQGSADGTPVYVETMTPVTNANGLVSIQIGGGSGFELIDWASGPYFLKTETDPAGGTNYSITGTSQLLSVPFALHAKTAESISGTLAEKDPIFGAWNKSTGISIAASQINDFQTTVANNSAVVANSAKNSYPSSDATKLAGIAAGAEVNVNADWNATSGDAQILNKPAMSVGTNNGDMQYWYGTHWVVIPAGTNGQTLTMVNGVPTWSGASSSITTTDVSSITAHSATSGGNIVSDGGSGITARGVCWSTSSNPTTSDSKTTDGSGTGSFTSSLTGLTAVTPYYVRAYATSSTGTAYGDQKQFTTTGGDGTFDYEGRTYAYKTIGTQTWMTQNLACLPSVSPSSGGSYTASYYYVYGYQGTLVSEAKATANYGTYGVLYNWPAALIACPSGWHLPNDAEWSILTDYLTNNGYGYGGSGSDIGKPMASTSGWTSNSTAGNIGNDQASNNSSGFTAFPGGDRYNGGGFGDLGSYTYFWSSSESDASYAWGRDLDYNGDEVYRNFYGKSNGFSVRCLQN